MHIVYFNNQQYIAQNINMTLLVVILSIFFLAYYTFTTTRQRTFSWYQFLGRIILSIYLVTVTGCTLTFYKWSSLDSYLAVIKGYGTFGKVSFAHLSLFNSNHVALSWYQMIGNLVLLMPLGFIAPFIFPKWREFFRVIPKIFLTTLMIEMIQGISTFLYLSNRIFDINDLAVNTTGGVIGYFLYLVTTRLLKGKNIFSKHLKEGKISEHNIYIKP